MLSLATSQEKINHRYFMKQKWLSQYTRNTHLFLIGFGHWLAVEYTFLFGNCTFTLLSWTWQKQTSRLMLAFNRPNMSRVAEHWLQEALLPPQRHVVRLDSDHGLQPHQDGHRGLQQANQGAGWSLRNFNTQMSDLSHCPDSLICKAVDRPLDEWLYVLKV